MTRGRLLIVGVSVLLVAVAVTTTEQGEELLHDLPAAERFYTRFVPPEPPEIGRSDQRAGDCRPGGPGPGRRASGVVFKSRRQSRSLSGRVVDRVRSPNHGSPACRLFFEVLTRRHIALLSSKSAAMGVSFREEGAWDLFLMNADGTDVRRLAEHAYHPTLSQTDPDSVSPRQHDRESGSREWS